jgi:hypothetical protein
VPQVRHTLIKALENDKDPVVIINPHREFSEKEISVFLDYISQGGKALIIDSSDRSKDSFASQLLEPLSMEVVYGEPSPNQDGNHAKYLFSENRDHERSVFFPTQDICEVKGGQPRLWYIPAQDHGGSLQKHWKPCLSEVSFGKGKVWVCTLSKAFSGLGLGNASSIPNKHQQNIYRVVFKVLNDLVDDENDPVMAFSKTISDSFRTCSANSPTQE